MSSSVPSHLDGLSAADIYRGVIFSERIRTSGQEWIVLNDSYRYLNLPQVEIYAHGIRLGGGRGPPGYAWQPPLAGWGLYFKRRVFHYRNGGGPVSGRQTSKRAELMAMHRALLTAPPNHHLVIYTSSYHVWECFEVWFDWWEVYGYFHEGERVGNRDLIHAIMRERRLRQGKVDIRYVSAPWQEPGLLIAEEIASDAARGRY